MTQQLPLSEEEQSFRDWLAQELERRGLTGQTFDWESVRTVLLASVPRGFMPAADAAIDKELWRKITRTLKDLGCRYYRGVVAPSDAASKVRPSGVWQNELPFLQFIDAQATRMKLALQDAAAIRRDVASWVVAHPDEDVTVEGMMQQIRAMARAS